LFAEVIAKPQKDACSKPSQTRMISPFRHKCYHYPMQVCFGDLILDSRRAVFIAEQKTLVISDLFLGLGALRRKKDLLPNSQHHDLWERLMGLLQDYNPSTVALLGDIKPGQGNVDEDEAEELHTLFRKLGSRDRTVLQVVAHPERIEGPVMEATGIKPVENHRIDPYTLMHRRRTFVYPRYDNPSGFWINGGVHPLFAVPTPDAKNEEGWLRYPAFLYTGFALVMPPFVAFAQGWEVMQVERLPRMARAWGVLGGNMRELDIPSLPPPPEALSQIVRPPSKFKLKYAQAEEG
jgi:metallophosphoesterase superfamily enzyme